MKASSEIPKDARGRPIQIGSRVRVIGSPDFSGLKPVRVRHERERVFGHIVGQCKTVDDIDQNGFVGFTFKIRSGRDAGLHCVWLDPCLVLVQKARVSA
jgi:hypothetical protein